MSNPDPRLHRLQLAVEQASGAMRATAWELEAIEDLLPERGNHTRKQQLRHAASRLSAVADLLTAETQAISPTTVGRVARIGRMALFGAGALVGSIGSGLGEAGGQHILEQFAQRHETAATCLEEVERAAPSAVQHMEEAVDEALAEVAERLRQIAADSPMRRHPAYMTVTEVTDTWSGDPRLSRREYLNGLTDVSMKMVSFIGPMQDWSDDTRASVVATRDATNAQWRRLIEVDAMLRSLEDG